MPTSDPSCPFCRIIHGGDPDVREIYRDPNVIAFFPTEPAALGHTLVTPLRHVTDIWALDSDLAERLARATIALAGAVRRAIGPEGLNIIQSNGAAATQTVMHLHVHVVPRWMDDRIGSIWPPETSYSEDQKDDAWDALRRECQSVMREGD